MTTYKPLNEVSINRFVTKHAKNGYVLVSASRDDRSEKENDALDIDLSLDIAKEGWSYSKIFGGFIENKGTPKEKRVIEKSFMIYNFNNKDKTKTFIDLANFAVKMCGKYNQESVLVAAPDKNPAYVNSNSKVLFTLGNNFKIRDVTQAYFSSISRNRKKAMSGANVFTMAESDNEDDIVYAECCLKMPATIMGRHSRALKGEIFPMEIELNNNCK